jgi:hypothetical protein
MALIKNKKAAIGIDGDYWRIIAVESHYGGPNQLWQDKDAKPVTFVHLAQYISKKARNDGAMSLETKRIVLDGETNGLPPDDPFFHKNPDYLPEPTRAAAYAALKQTRDFLDAADD